MLVQTGDQIVDLLRNGQGVLNIVSLGPVVSDLASELHDVDPSERVTIADVGRAARRREVGERAIDIAELPHETVRFADNSERQFAKLLDFYNIAWEYEPRTFTLANGTATADRRRRSLPISTCPRTTSTSRSRRSTRSS